MATLHTWFRSSCAYRLRIALLWKGVPFTSKPVDIIIGEQFTPEYRQINPMAEVPALEVEEDGTRVILTQSMAILAYLEEKFTNKPLLPSVLLQRQWVRQLCEIITSGTQPLQNLRVVKRHGVDDGWPVWAINIGFTAFEQCVSKTAGKYCVGDEVTLADVVLAPQVYNALVVFNMDVHTQFPTIFRIYQELNKLDAFQQAAPEVQPDCPTELRQLPPTIMMMTASQPTMIASA